MELTQIHGLTSSFESASNKTDVGIEFWLARDLQHLLGYSKWDNFKNINFDNFKNIKLVADGRRTVKRNFKVKYLRKLIGNPLN